MIQLQLLDNSLGRLGRPPRPPAPPLAYQYEFMLWIVYFEYFSEGSLLQGLIIDFCLTHNEGTPMDVTWNGM